MPLDDVELKSLVKALIPVPRCRRKYVYQTVLMRVIRGVAHMSEEEIDQEYGRIEKILRLRDLLVMRQHMAIGRLDFARPSANTV